MVVITSDYGDLPDVSGAYVLLFKLIERIPLEIAKFQGVVIKPGHYAYAGSARGPGGIRGRK
jgi:Uri superfamily endonuclease